MDEKPKKKRKRKPKASTQPAPPPAPEPEPEPVEPDFPETDCWRCGSTDHEPYGPANNVCNHATRGENGELFDTVAWYWTACRNCGQRRCDKFYENRGRLCG